jgi:hypothetical protein
MRQGVRAKNIFLIRAGVGIDAKKCRSLCPIGEIGWHFLSRKRETAKTRNSGEPSKWETIGKLERGTDKGMTEKWQTKKWASGNIFLGGRERVAVARALLSH